MLMKTKRCWFILIILMLLLLASGVYAADALYRFMHNDHDALIIGEIVSIEEDSIKVRVEKNIISAKDLNVNQSKKQLKLTEAEIISPFKYGLFYDDYDSSKASPSLGDYVLISVIKSGKGFKNAWGAYKVDSLDYKNLSITLPDNPSIWKQMDAAAIKAFVNSDGQITEFSFDGDTKTVRSGESIIFDGNDEDADDIIPDDGADISKPPVDEKEISSSIGIIGGADGPTSIFIAGNLLKTLVVPIIAYSVIIFGIGFSVGYIVKGRKL